VVPSLLKFCRLAIYIRVVVQEIISELHSKISALQSLGSRNFSNSLGNTIYFLCTMFTVTLFCYWDFLPCIFVTTFYFIFFLRREESLPIFKRRLLGDLLDFSARELQVQVLLFLT
jgi:hypothetical protein